MIELWIKERKEFAVLKTIKQNTSAVIIQKKSKFIANLFYVQAQEEIEEILKEIKRKYHDARHHCYAYSIMTETGRINRMSDDGEPNGTAGMPMLNILLKQEMTNVLVVVTRYFGGILLGTGGLVRAYSDATIEAIKKAELVTEQRGYEVEITIAYQDLEKFQYYCQKNGISIEKIEYEEKVKCKIEITKEEKDRIIEIKEDAILKIEEIKIRKEKNIRKNIEI